MTAVGVIGLGAMGSRVALRLLDAGHRVIVWNRTSAKAAPLVHRGATLATSPAEAARRADVVITMVADPSALRSVTEGAVGIAAGIQHEGTVLEMSTVGPDAVSRLASVLPDGTGLLDAPVVGSLSEAESGSLVIFVGGPPQLVERWTPLLSTLGSPVHVGAIGIGAAAKLVANSTFFGVLGVLGEALALAETLGLSRNVTFEVLATTPLAAQAERRREAIERGDYPARFALTLACKDARLISEAATAHGLDLRLAKAGRTWLSDAEDAGWGTRDYTAVLARILAGTHREARPT